MQDCLKLKRYNEFKEFSQLIQKNEKDDIKAQNTVKMNHEEEINNTTEEEIDEMVLSISHTGTYKKSIVEDNENKKCMDLTEKIFLYKEIFGTKFNEGSIENQVDKFIEIFKKLEVNDEHLSEKHKAAIILNSLPESYSKIVLKFKSSKTLNFNEVIKEVLKEENKRKKRRIRKALKREDRKKNAVRDELNE